MRKSGILLHIASLPNKYGIGTMGREAYNFVDWLKSAGQSLWQILPLSLRGFTVPEFFHIRREPLLHQP